MKYGFVGVGNMGGALAEAVCKAAGAGNVYVANRSVEKAEALSKKTGCHVSDNKSIAENAEFVFLGIKPQMLDTVLDASLKERLCARKESVVIVSMLAAVSIESLREKLGFAGKIIRIMPNTPVAVGEGVISFSVSENVSADEKNEFLKIMEKAGLLMEMPESKIDAATCVAGCGPAFAQMFIEGLADGGVALGLSRAEATKMAAQMILGSAKLTLESGKTPGELREAVCSPAGSTIYGVRALEEKGFRGAAMDAVISAYERTLEMKKK